MLSMEALCASFKEAIGWPYVSPGTNDARGIDCSGMFVRAYRAQGSSIYHGSNTIWRVNIKSGFRLTSKAQLRVGMAVFKAKAWTDADKGNKWYGQGENMCHIGLVVSVKPLQIVHASTEGMKVKVDSALGKWKYAGELREVDYGTSTVEPLVGGTSTYPTLKRGSRGADVRVLQNGLMLEGYPVEVDGIFGLETRSAVVAYQKANGLTPDGVVGKLTWAMLGVG